MPSLMPGRHGTKEAFGISIIREELGLTVPPKALAHYGLETDGEVVLTTTHRGEGGFALLIPDLARATVFAAYLARLTQPEKIYWFSEKAYTAMVLREGRLFLTPEILQAFHLGVGTRLMVVKSTTVAMSFTPVEIWQAKFLQRGLDEAVRNMELLEEF
ncbi:MAG TPA: hypothetical protein PKI62_05495 [bacterium]|nr:hypothetical protein [bacterium]HPR89208.1 hypothetical protein [bacterium]